MNPLLLVKRMAAQKASIMLQGAWFLSHLAPALAGNHM